MHVRKLGSSLLSVATAVAGFAVVAVPMQSASAAAGDGSINIQVIQDVNADGQWTDPVIEPGLAGVKVQVTNAAGATQTLTTDADGKVTFTGAPGDYRVVALNPDPTTMSPAVAHESTGTSETP